MRRRRRRNPERAYFVRDHWAGRKSMEEFGSLRSAIKFAMRSGGFQHADEVIKHIYVERGESYVPLSLASRAAARVVAEYANRNPMKRRRNCRNPRSQRETRLKFIRHADTSAHSRLRGDRGLGKKEAAELYARLHGFESASQALRYLSKFGRQPEHSNPKLRNPGHPSYAQHLMRLGLHHGDPIIELASVWASGADAGTRLIKQALVSAEHWRESKDKRLRQAMTSVVNKLSDYLRDAERREVRRAPKSHRTIHPAWQTNPKRRSKRRSRR